MALMKIYAEIHSFLHVEHPKDPSRDQMEPVKKVGLKGFNGGIRKWGLH